MIPGKTSNIVFASIAITLVTVVIFSQPGEQTHSGIIPSDYSPSSISIKHSDEEQIHLKRTPAGWQIKIAGKNIEISANQYKIDRIINALKATSGTTINDYTSLKEYGLEANYITLKLDDIEIRLGRTDPIKHRRYIMIGAQVQLIDDSIYPHIIDSQNEFISKELSVPIQLNAINIGDKRLYVGNDKYWTSNRQLSREQIQSILDAWRYTPAINVNIVTQFAQDIAIQMQDIDGKIHSFQAQVRNGQLFIFDPQRSIEYHMPSGARQQLFITE